LTTEVSQFPPGNFSQHHAVNAALQMPGNVIVLVFLVGITLIAMHMRNVDRVKNGNGAQAMCHRLTASVVH